MIGFSLNALYAVIGITKQGVWDHFRREEAELAMIKKVIGQVDERRCKNPGEGLEKIYGKLQPEQMGRDKFCRIFKQLGYGIRRRTNPVRTTIPAHKVFDNLIEGRVVTGSNQVWQSDITYIKIGDRFYYLTFIIDVYTRRIVGYAVSKNLRAEANIKALQMALEPLSEQQIEGLVHHSDRGSQYTDGQYLGILRDHGIRISMGRKAQDNAYAERINGVIKNEYLIPRGLKSYQQLCYYTRQAVADYNTERHHGNLPRCAPNEYETLYGKLPENERVVEAIRSGRTPSCLEASLQLGDIEKKSQYPYCIINLK
jgi:putative transposase